MTGKKIQITIAGILLCSVLLSQHDHTMYFMENLPQSNYTNPAMQHPCKMNFGGLLIPIVGQVLPPIQLNVGSSGFKYTDLIHYGTGEYKDSLIQFLHPAFDRDKLFKRMNRVNNLDVQFQLTWLNAAYRYKKYYFTFSMTDKMYARVSIPREFIKFPVYGNGHEDYLGKIADFSGLAASMTYFREYAIGVSTEIRDDLIIGVRPKILFGKANLQTKKNMLTLHTDQTSNFPITVETDFEFRMAQPAFEFQGLGYFPEQDSFAFEVKEIIDSTYETMDIVKATFFNSKNFGLGIDIGGVWEYSSKLSIYGSIIDIGYIKWKDHPARFTDKGKYIFEGAELTEMIRGNDSISIEEEIMDTVLQIFEPQLEGKAYSVSLSPKFYLGGLYTLNEQIKIGALFRSEVYHDKFHSSISFSANYHPKKWMNATLTYSIINNSAKNIGLGYFLKAGFYQFYMMTDNILAIFPQSMRNFNIRFGANLIFGCKENKLMF